MGRGNDSPGNRSALFNGSHYGGTCLGTGLYARLDEPEEPTPLFRCHKCTCPQEMVYNAILHHPLKTLNVLLLFFNRRLIGRCRRQKVDETELPLVDLLSQLLQPGVKPVPFSTQLLELVGCQVELKEKRPVGESRPMHSGERGQLVSEIRPDKK